ncbi:MAG: exodeoxyribonuclease VII large subunit [Desulfuromonadales bacterium]|nr:exodeoxyribonuclease VII large subunit [Desulfuromonadales bacterium]
MNEPATPMNLTVSRLVELIREVVESNFFAVTVEGEVSNFAAPSSGHWYFTLKDGQAQLRAVMFRSRNRLAVNPPADGLNMVCSGTVSVYAARGEVQLIVDSLAPSGIGSLQAAFEALKARLAAEGLFAEARKRPLPVFPRTVGIVTSMTGAAIHDMLNVLRRRAPGLRVVLRPAKVQGDGAAGEIAAAIADLNRHGEADVLIVGRGGGSLEDLWAFNEEVVARAIAASTIPVISAVGHEVDVTIADFTADLRAPTPSAAAELVAKSRLELESHVDHLIMRLQSRITQGLALLEERLTGLENRLQLAARCWPARSEQIRQLEHRLELAMTGLLRQQGDRLARAVGQLDALSPLGQLARGYVIASRDAEGRKVVRLADLTEGDHLWLRFSQGLARTRVEEVSE